MSRGETEDPEYTILQAPSLGVWLRLTVALLGRTILANGGRGLAGGAGAEVPQRGSWEQVSQWGRVQGSGEQ